MCCSLLVVLGVCFGSRGGGGVQGSKGAKTVSKLQLYSLAGSTPMFPHSISPDPFLQAPNYHEPQSYRAAISNLHLRSSQAAEPSRSRTATSGANWRVFALQMRDAFANLGFKVKASV